MLKMFWGSSGRCFICMPLYFNMEEAFSLDVKILWNKIYCIALCNDRVHKSQYVLFPTVS